MNSSHVTDMSWRSINVRAVDLYEQLTAHPHYATHEIDIDGERKQAHRLHTLPHVALLEDALAIQSRCGLIHSRIDQDQLDPDLRRRIVQAIDQTLRHVSVPAQQQYH